ncbi:beta family protein [Streptomyces sp. AK02-01A]|uniref:beta family protein n=1 Tax=Streptomyces sp. AK02-01A TaxID=3028648 RepID=UPI0029A15876|nr:hypothetical protein [Streptomyces sp. AK02-01A]MDX3849542.1 hypothetical protein [Streptomyces sp. AK02-01A]MDX3849888.1 hypothetical protein [Streptomyces sp. AK02-01A]
MTYVPILKGKRGEFTALGKVAPEVQAQIRPVLEVVPDEGRRDVLETFRKHAWKELPKGLEVAVDCGALWHAGPVGGFFTGHSMNWLSEAFGAWLLPMVPVFRVFDPPGALREVRDVHRAHGLGAMLRLDIVALPADSSAISHEVRRALHALGITPEQVDLVLDAGYVPSDVAVAQAVPAMLHALDWARTAPWRQVVTAGGSFPQTLARLPRDRPNRLHRWETALWHKVARSFEGTPPVFGDYGVSHPAMPAKGWRGSPNLRYTVGEDWQVYVASQRRPGNDDFFALCAHLLESDHWAAQGEATSWGDQQFALCAHGHRAKAGAASEWRAWATSHHLAVVANSLASLGTP